jgi:hypothetical protein
MGRGRVTAFQETYLHHESHRELLCPTAGPEPADWSLDAVIVPTARPVASLAEAARLAEALGCPLVTLHSAGRTSSAEAARCLGRDVDLIAIDVSPEAERLNLPDWETSRLLAGTVFARRGDVSAKRNLGLMLSYMMGWSRVLFLDDDITKLNPDDMRAAGALLGQYNAVGFHNDGYPDNSVACHAHRMAGVRQQAFLGSGALAVDLGRSGSFFPDIYNDDWFYLLDGDKHLQPTTVTGHIHQHPYDPFASPDRARSEELGEVLAEGLSWQMDQDRSVAEADQLYWSGFLPRRAQFLHSVLELVEKSVIAIHEKDRQTAALRGALERLSLITPALCEGYLRAWAADRRQWQLHLDQLPTGLPRTVDLALLTRPGSSALTWHRPEPGLHDASTQAGAGALVT